MCGTPQQHQLTGITRLIKGTSHLFSRYDTIYLPLLLHTTFDTLPGQYNGTFYWVIKLYTYHTLMYVVSLSPSFLVSGGAV